jgi:hypothetical protein
LQGIIKVETFVGHGWCAAKRYNHDYWYNYNDVTWEMLLIVVGLQQCIAAEFVLQLFKTSSKPIPYLTRLIKMGRVDGFETHDLSNAIAI